MMRSNMPEQMRSPNAPAGKGYNREGFRGRGPMAARPDMTTMPVQARPALPAQAADMARTAMARRPGFKKGGMVTPKGNGCCSKNKPCKMS